AGLSKSREALAKSFTTVRAATFGAEEVSLEGVEAALIQADVGVKMTERLIDELRRGPNRSAGDIRRRLHDLIIARCGAATGLAAGPRPLVMLFVGINGVGKTTSIAKLAHRYRNEGRRVLLAAGDTFRAAAVEQLQTWGTRLGAEVVHQGAGADPAAVVFDAVTAARSRDVDVLLIDTAGRLHTKQSLMEELVKIKRVIGRALPGAPHEILLVLDASTGQNGLAQARAFQEMLGLTGIVVTKVDGTSKAGIVLAIAEELHVPVKLLGLGEAADALVPFDAQAFAAGLVGSPESTS
ncbi:MAG: signal recognition particle-docking protein FtsY, partial [Nitrospiria bacterium]